MTTEAVQRGRILTMLGEGPATSIDFTRAGILRFSARIHELRKAGFHIIGRRIAGERSWEYRLGAE